MPPSEHRDFNRTVAAAAHARGYEGLLVLSAALPGLNLVLLPDNLGSDARLRVVRSIELLITIAQ